jgi:hypothetical protein
LGAISDRRSLEPFFSGPVYFVQKYTGLSLSKKAVLKAVGSKPSPLSDEGGEYARGQKYVLSILRLSVPTQPKNVVTDVKMPLRRPIMSQYIPCDCVEKLLPASSQPP